MEDQETPVNTGDPCRMLTKLGGGY